MAISKYTSINNTIGQHFFVKKIQRNFCKITNHSSLRPDIILSDENREKCIKNLKIFRSLSESTENTKKAAVLVPLCLHNNELGLLYTLRSTKLNTNRGQVSFPGGIRDIEDKSFEDTALRETWEELKIPKDKVIIWSSATLIGRKHVNVMPILGYIGHVNPEHLKVNPQEVEEAFVVSLKNLCDPKQCSFTQFRNNYTLPTYLGGKYRIWGLTALITHIIMKALVPNVYRHELPFLQPIEQLVKITENNKPLT
ncbi:hypothetical protein PV326_006107 [Microctonus aethiopoides]|uniref:Nudix hydrolase domain-containing protein n=1 Tax=Microctonus aethiopoides TaxID=144406 RepID=A0AA39FBM7_9HYME|nr:hypothetical protein PV326_006107 [Microctonus aethiopoides]KAK0166491.1 hypothetical protein PV328_004906 [Microctonus aethiopoides]